MSASWRSRLASAGHGDRGATPAERASQARRRLQLAAGELTVASAIRRNLPASMALALVAGVVFVRVPGSRRLFQQLAAYWARRALPRL